MARASESLRRFHLQFARVLLTERDQVAEGLVMPGVRVEHFLQCGPQVERTGQRLADLQQRGELLELFAGVLPFLFAYAYL